MKKLLIATMLIGAVAHADQDVRQKSQIVTETVVAASTSTSNTVAVLANQYRKFLLIRNHDASLPIFISFSGNVTPTTGSTIKIAADSTWNPSVAPINKIYVFTTSGSTSATIMSGN